MKKIIVRFSKIILVIAFLNIFAASVNHVANNGQFFGVLTKPFKSYIEFIVLVQDVINGIVAQIKPYHVIADKNFKEINLLEKNIYSLNAHFELDRYIFKLRNMRNDSLIHSWSFTKDKFVGSFEKYLVAHPQNPILLNDGSLIGMLYDTENLFRLDKSSNIIWHNTSRTFHHSINMSHDNHVWACTSRKAATKSEHSNNYTIYKDDVLTKIDVETGTVAWEKSLSDILISNGFINIVHGYSNDEFSYGADLFHLNDIEPINFNGKFWLQGDLLLSLRNRSLIIHYRPETNKILRMISGPFLAQHDVDIISENEISIFNNNRTGTEFKAGHVDVEGNKDYNIDEFKLKSSNIVVYNFADSTFSTPFLDLFEQENIYTHRQGVHTFLENGDLFVESTETGKIYIFRDDKVILQKYANKVQDKGTTEYPHWMRIYENVNFLNE